MNHFDRDGEGNGTTMACLAHPTAMMGMVRDFSAANFQCWFAGVGRNEFLLLLGESLHSKRRFAGFLRDNRDYSVLLHSLQLAYFFMDRREYRLVFPAAIHDCAEIFVDMPKPIKTIHDERKEQAIFDAVLEMMGWELPVGLMKDPEILYWDFVACVAEAKLWGHDWEWVKEAERSSDQFRLNLGLYLDSLSSRVIIDDPVSSWVDLVDSFSNSYQKQIPDLSAR